MNLRQREMPDFRSDLFWRQTQIVPAGDATNGNTGTGDAWSTLTDIRRSLNQGSNINRGWHVNVPIRSHCSPADRGATTENQRQLNALTAEQRETARSL